MTTFQFAFAGHNRPHDLGHVKQVSEGLDGAFDLLRRAGVDQARLLSGLAPGADDLATAAWRRANLGTIHAVFPFLEDDAGSPIGAEGVAQSATWLDGRSTEAGGRSAHLKQARLIVERADLLVVVWSGAPARGAGGTADAVRIALEMGLAVLWVNPSEPGRPRLIRPEKLPFDFDFSEFQEGLQAGYLSHVELAEIENLRTVLNLDTAPASRDEGEDDSDSTNGAGSKVDDWLHGWLWKTYGTFRRIAGGRVSGIAAGPPIPPDLSAQPGFQLLNNAYLKADQSANRLAAVHRSQQILLVLMMVTAAIVASLPALWPNLKIETATIELWLSLMALWVWSRAARARQNERWSEERHLAERLRLERAGWALGVSLLSARTRTDARNDGERSRDVLREAGLPHGKFDSARVTHWGAWAMSELVAGQAAYHRATSIRDGKIAHRIHHAENMSFVLLLLTLSTFLLLNLAANAMGAELPHWVSAIVTMAGTVIPSVAAATMALEAKLEFKEQSERSERIAERLDDLAVRLGPEPSFDNLQSAARAAMQWHMTQENHWREGASRRRLFRP